MLSDVRSRSLEIKRSKSFFWRLTPLNCHNLKSRLFSSLSNSKHDDGRIGLKMSRIDKGQKSERSDHNETDNNSLKCNS